MIFLIILFLIILFHLVYSTRNDLNVLLVHGPCLKARVFSCLFFEMVLWGNFSSIPTLLFSTNFSTFFFLSFFLFNYLFYRTQHRGLAYGISLNPPNAPNWAVNLCCLYLLGYAHSLAKSRQISTLGNIPMKKMMSHITPKHRLDNKIML